MNQNQAKIKDNNSAERILGKSLPFNLGAERAFLGALMLNDGKSYNVSDLLSANDFYIPAHRIIFETIVQIINRGDIVDTIVMHDELERCNKLQDAGGITYIMDLQEELPPLNMLDQYARIIKENAQRRAIITEMSHLLMDLFKSNSEDLDILADKGQKIFTNIENTNAIQEYRSIRDIFLSTVEDIKEMAKKKCEGITGIISGFEYLDNLTGGFQQTDFIILAARPGMGKTALALNMAYNASKNKIPTGFISLEMSSKQLAMRLISSINNINNHDVKVGRISQLQWKNITQGGGLIVELPLYINDRPDQVIAKIKMGARKLKKDHDIQILFIDYLQLINSSKRSENRNQEITEISRSLKGLAKELNIPIVCLSQLSRLVEGRVDKRPILSDLRDSGAIEQDADIVMFLYRDIIYNKQTQEPNVAELIIGKHRSGALDTIKLHFNKQTTTFYDIK